MILKNKYKYIIEYFEKKLAQKRAKKVKVKN